MRLDLELLARFDAALWALGAPIVNAWAPGLSDEEIDALLLPLGIDLPEEARVWWRWHNGTREDASIIARHLWWRVPLSLRDAAEDHATGGQLIKEVWGVEKLLCPAVDKPMIYFCCAGLREEPVPIYTQNDIETPSEVLPSIGELVLAWLELIDQGVWTIASDGSWTTHPEKIPDSVIEMGII